MSSTQSVYWRGFRDGAPFVLVVVPFGVLFGVVATEAGLNLAEVMTMTALVIAGAAQFAAVALMQENAPTIIVLATALAVNMRMAMYSAALAPHLGPAPLWQRAIAAYFLVDQTYACSAVTFEAEPEMPLRQKIVYFFGTVSPVCFPWYLATLAGALLGEAIPPEYALDFAVPITFLAITAPMMRTLAHVVAAAVSVAVSLALSFLPYNLWLMIAAVLAMMAGARVELWTQRRRARA